MNTALFDHATVSFTRPVATVVGGAYKESSTTSIATGVRCMIQEKTGDHVLQRTGQRRVCHAKLYCELGTNIEPADSGDDSDIITVTKHRSIPVGTVYRVLDVINRGGVDSPAAEHLEVLLVNT